MKNLSFNKFKLWVLAFLKPGLKTYLNINKAITCFILLLALTIPGLTQTKNVSVTITGIRSNDGNISFGIFKDNESFKKEKAWKSIRVSKTKMKNGMLKASFYLPPGVYGLTLLDDENSNGKMEYNWIGIPKEGFAFSDGYWHTGMSRPDISEFDIVVKDGEVTNTLMKVKYMLDRD